MRAGRRLVSSKCLSSRLKRRQVVTNPARSRPHLADQPQPTKSSRYHSRACRRYRMATAACVGLSRLRQ